jgi:DNA-binding Xre family transcriptional regulator
MVRWVATEFDKAEAAAIAKRVADRMAEIGMGKEGLAAVLGVTEDTIHRLTRGETVKRWVNLIKLARALHTSPNDLLGFDGRDTRVRLREFLEASYRGLGATPALARNYSAIFLEALDKPPDPGEPLPASELLRLDIKNAKREFESQ